MRDPRHDRVVVCVAPPRRLSCMSHGDPEKRAIMGTSWRRGGRLQAYVNQRSMLRKRCASWAVTTRVCSLCLFLLAFLSRVLVAAVTTCRCRAATELDS